jgi:hypothetical protein
VSKVKPLLPGPVAAARRVLDECDVRHPRDIHVEAIAARYGAIVVYAPMDTARGALVRSANRAVIWIDQDAEGEAHARFTGAHEFAHFLLHSAIDHFVQACRWSSGGRAPKRGVPQSTDGRSRCAAASLRRAPRSHGWQRRGRLRESVS